MRILSAIAGLALLVQGAPKEASWKDAQGVKVPVPPPDHPRLYLRAKHLPDLAARLNHPVLKPVADGLRQMAAKDPQVKVEWDALQYLVTRDKELGLAAAAAALDLLRKAQLPDVHDACRVTGRWMVTGAIAYDWLYPLLTKDQKDAFVKELVRLAKTLECGYPPAGQG